MGATWIVHFRTEDQETLWGDAVPMLCSIIPYCATSPGLQIGESRRVMLSKYVPIGLGGKQAMANKLLCAQISDTLSTELRNCKFKGSEYVFLKPGSRCFQAWHPKVATREDLSQCLRECTDKDKQDVQPSRTRISKTQLGLNLKQRMSNRGWGTQETPWSDLLPT